jgi:hypothetical protein
LLSKNVAIINWQKVCRNPHAFKLIVTNFGKLRRRQWTFLSANPAAAPLLAAQPDMINWNLLCHPMGWTENSYFVL